MQISSSIALHKNALQIHSISCGLFSGPDVDLISAKMAEMAKTELDRNAFSHRISHKKMWKTNAPIIKCQWQKVISLSQKKMVPTLSKLFLNMI